MLPITEQDPEPGGSRRNSALVAAGILASRLAGLVREAALGFFLGAGPAVDAFRAALRIPNLLQNLLGEGVLSASFIPVYARLLDEGREEEAGRVAGAIAGLMATLAAALVVLGVVFARPLTLLLAPGFPEAKLELTVTLVRILTPGVGFLVLSAWCLGVLNSHRRFFLSYVAPVLWNAAMITALAAFGLRGVTGDDLAVVLAWGALAGGLAQLAVQLPSVIRLSRGLRPSLDTRNPGVRQVIRAFGPIVAGRGVVQLSGYVDLFLTSFLAAGALAALGYAQVLYLLPISLFGMSVAAAELPDLSTAGSADRAAVVRRLERGLARIAFFVVPTTIGYLVLGDLIVGALLQRGQFDADTTVQVWVILGAYTLGLLAATSSRLLQSALYGVGNTRIPAQIATARVIGSALLGVVLMLQLDQVQAGTAGIALVGDLPAWGLTAEALRGADANAHRLGAAGLGLAAGAFAWFEYGLLRRAVRLRFGHVRLGGPRFGPILLAAAAAGAVGLTGRVLLAGLPTLALAAAAIGLTAAAYLAITTLAGVSELDGLVGRLRRR